jgi:outer membrane protein TolC
MKRVLLRLVALLSLMLAAPLRARAEQSLSLPDCIDLALKQNPAVLKAQEELRRTRGAKVEAWSAAVPNVTATAQYRRIDDNFIDQFPGGSQIFGNQTEPWSAQVEVTQALYSGGRILAAIRAAKYSDQIAVLDFERAVAETILSVRRTFYEILLAKAQVAVREQSVTLLEQQLTDTQHRFDVGAVPRFNVLRAEVELANARPPLIRAQNNLRLAREALVTLLAIDAAPGTADFTPITLTGELRFESSDWTLSNALVQALVHRPELQQAGKQVIVAKQGVKIAQAGYKPDIELFGDYGIRNSTFSDEVDESLHGWTIGARATWYLFDGLLTHGKVTQARAQYRQAQLEADDTRRRVELEVRQAYSDYRQALELIEAQKKTVEQGEESLRLAEARFRAGTGTQLDVLSAQTALTEARSNEAQSLYDYNVAVATLERVTGLTTTRVD